MKLYLTLEGDEGQKVERVMVIPPSFEKDGIGSDEYVVDPIVDEMINSLKESKKPL